MPRLSARFIETEIQHPERGQRIIRDDELRGFGIRVTKNCISYIVERKIDGKTRRITLGRYKFMTPEVARHKAQALLLNGGFLHAADRSQRSVTLQEVLERFLEIRNLRLNTIRSYRGLTCRCFNDWLKQPIVNITRDMVQSRHQSLTRTTRQNSPGRVQANMAMRI